MTLSEIEMSFVMYSLHSNRQWVILIYFLRFVRVLWQMKSIVQLHEI